MNEYLSLTELGKIYGVSSHQVGKWLKNLGLRTPEGRPSIQAFSQGIVEKKSSRLEKKPAKSLTECNTQEPTNDFPGSFWVRQSGTIGQEIIDKDGKIIAWTTDIWVAQVICKLLSDNEEMVGR